MEGVFRQKYGILAGFQTLLRVTSIYRGATALSAPVHCLGCLLKTGKNWKCPILAQAGNTFAVDQNHGNMYIDYIRLEWEKVSKRSYLQRIPSIRKADGLRFNAPVTFFVGENGSGKSTLLEAIAVAYGFNPEGGSYNYRFSTFDDHSNLHNAVVLGKGRAGTPHGFFLRAESFYTMASKTLEYEFGEGGSGPMYGKKTLHEQSHGESFLNFILTFSKGLFIMDEPEAALSPHRQLALFSKIVQMAREGSQYIIVTHSPILLAIPGAEIYAFDQTGIHQQAYEETDSYRCYELFLNHRKTIISQLTSQAL